MRTTHYNGTTTLDFDTFCHTYVADGIEVPSVTQICSIMVKDALLQWGANQSAYYLRDRLQGEPAETLAALVKDSDTCTIRLGSRTERKKRKPPTSARKRTSGLRLCCAGKLHRSRIIQK